LLTRPEGHPAHPHATDAEMASWAKEALRFLWDAGNEFFNDRCPSMAASLSYYTFFSLPPLLILLLLLAGTIADPQDIQGAILQQIRSLVGAAGAEQVRIILRQAESPGTGRPLATVLGLAALVFGATTAFGELQNALNRAWRVEPDPARGILRNFLVKRVFSFGMVLVVVFLLLVSLVLSAALVAFGDALLAPLPGGIGKTLLQGLNFLVTYAVITLLFAAMFRVIPDAEIAWGDVWHGAVVTALFFVAGKFLLGLYLGSIDPGHAYGAAGSLAVVLIWVYYSSMILLFGAEFTRVRAERYGTGIVPEEGAVQVVEEKHRIR
jgi:membrane protein